VSDLLEIVDRYSGFEGLLKIRPVSFVLGKASFYILNAEIRFTESTEKYQLLIWQSCILDGEIWWFVAEGWF